jgi:hypothetical protein
MWLEGYEYTDIERKTGHSCFRRSKFDTPRRSDFDPLFKLTNHLVYKVHVSLPSPKALSVHIQDQCVVGNPI